MTATQPAENLSDESPRRRLIRRIITTIVIIACIGGLVVAAHRTARGDKDEPTFTGVSTAVVQLQAPAPDSSVLSQAQLLIDLSSPYDATFVVNGVLIPDDQLQKRPELNQVIFNPGKGKVIEKWGAGRNCVEADIFRIDGTQQDVPPVRWCFNVT
ncbi:MAG TPA: hypothetical protein VGZ52_04290 [Acidimicrobiales bacterium]|nr:hypothetical protein [Acidimicrobiales bacterium]